MCWNCKRKASRNRSVNPGRPPTHTANSTSNDPPYTPIRTQDEYELERLATKLEPVTEKVPSDDSGIEIQPDTASQLDVRLA